MNARRAVLGAADIDGRGVQVNLLPAKVNQLADAQRMPEGHQDQQPIAARIAALASSGHQLVDLGFRQIFALPVSAFLARPPRTVGFSDREGRNWMTVFIGKFPL
jgi:hypothetical protein